jgi:hypothetical protein
MSNEFYSPLLEVAGPIAEEYGVSIADVLGLLLHARGDETLVRRVLTESQQSEPAREAASQGRMFDLVAHARPLLDKALHHPGT